MNVFQKKIKQDPSFFWGPLAFAGLVAGFYWRVIWGGSIFMFVDSSRFFYPFWKWGNGVLHQGIIPLWNPDAQFGTPYLADPQMAAAYPPVFLSYAFLKPTDAFAWLVILHHFWALLGFWVWARRGGFTPPAAFWGSLAFGFSLHVVCSSWTPVALFAISWIPWIFWAAEKVQENRPGAWWGLSFIWAMQTAAGYQVLSYLTGLALAAHLIWKSLGTWPWWPTWKSLRWVPSFSFAAVLAILYNLVWVLPFLELKRLSNYGNGPVYVHPLRWADFATWVSPFFQGHPLMPDYHGPHYWIGTYFMGLPVAALLVWGLWNRAFRKTSRVLFGLFLVLSLGETLYLASFLKIWLPGYSLVIRSGFWLPVVVLFAARLATEAAEKFSETGFKKEGQVVSWFLVWILVFTFSFWLKLPLTSWSFGLSLALGLLAGAPRGIAPRWRWFLLTLSLLVSLGQAATSVNILMKRSYYDQTPSALAEMGKPGRLFYAPSVLAQSKKLKGASMAQAYEAAKESLYPNWPLAYGREEAQVYNSLYLAAADNWVWTSLHFSKAQSRAVMNYLDVRYLLGPNRFKDFKPVARVAGGLEIEENPTALPKWTSVRQAWQDVGLAGDFKKASGQAWNYAVDCFVSKPSLAGIYPPNRVREISRRPGRVELLASGNGPALLVSSETVYPGWKAWVEGEPRPLVVVNRVFQGLDLRNGERHVILSYAPDSFRLGLFVCLLVLAFWTVGWFRGRLL
ncbi:MAG: hypothetical protein ACREL1_03270 [bacterium]